MANVMLEIWDSFSSYEFWCTDTQRPRFCKWHWVLNWRKRILVVDIPTQNLLTISLSIDHSSRYKWKVNIITHTKDKLSTTNWYSSQNWYKAMKVKIEAKAKFEWEFPLIHLQDHIRKQTASGHYTGMVLLDIQKALDSIDHKILSNKLSAMGVQPTDWFSRLLI